jgi:hypothetical protein
MMMDADLYLLNQLYLQKVREWLHSGQEHKAQYLLGVPTETLALLKNLSLAQIHELAHSHLLCFGCRLTPQVLRDYLQHPPEAGSNEILQWQWLTTATEVH